MVPDGMKADESISPPPESTTTDSPQHHWSLWQPPPMLCLYKVNLISIEPDWRIQELMCLI